MGLLDNALTAFGARLANLAFASMADQFGLSKADRERIKRMTVYRRYSEGIQPDQLKVSEGGTNDNLVINLSGKAIDKSVALLFGGDVKFDFGDDDGGDEDSDKQFIDNVWNKNKKPIFLHKLGETGGENGTYFIKILPDGLQDGTDRLVSLDPLLMRIITDPQDVETIIGYVQSWVFTKTLEASGGKRARSIEVLMRETSMLNEDGDSWEIDKQQKSKETNNKWVSVEGFPVTWDFAFPPIHHGQNLPNDHSPWGKSDIMRVLGLQDRVNYIASNISKIIRNHAHPKTVVLGAKLDENSIVMSGADMMINFPGSDGIEVFNLEMQSELESSMKYLNFLINTFFDVTDTVSINSIKEKLGQLTNFAIRVIYQDALQKLSVKRDLYGDFLTEINRRLLIIDGESEDSSGGTMVWPTEVLPIDRKEETDLEIDQVEAGLKSKETASTELGNDWEKESERIVEEAAAGTNIGAQLLQAFNRGQ